MNAEQNPELAKDLPDTTDDYEEFSKKDFEKLVKRGAELADKA